MYAEEFPRGLPKTEAGINALDELYLQTLVESARSLSVVQAKALANRHMVLRFKHLQRLDLDAAEALTEGSSRLFMDGLLELKSVPLARKLVVQNQWSDHLGGGLYLPKVYIITPEVAEVLATSGEGVSLYNLDPSSTEVVEKLARGKRHLTLGISAANLTIEAAALLSNFDGRLRLPGIYKLDAQVAHALSGGKARVILPSYSKAGNSLDRKILRENRVQPFYRFAENE